MARESNPRLARLLADDSYAQAEYVAAYGASRKPLSQLSPTYRRRVLRGLAAGKTKGQARGHTPRPGGTEYQRRKSRILADTGLTPHQYTEVRRLAANSNTDWDDVQLAINRGMSPADIRETLRRKIEAQAARAIGDKTLGQENFARRKQWAPISLYWYN